MMKKLSVLLLFLLITTTGTAQHHSKRERIKAVKTAYLTEELNLSSKEAEKFWPIYNKYEKIIFGYKVQKTREELRRADEMQASGSLNEDISEEILATLIQNEKQVTRAKEELFRELQSILSSKRILKLYQAELDFNKRLLSELRSRGFKGR